MTTAPQQSENVTTLVLYGCWRSTCTHRVILALRYKGIEFNYRPIDLTEREQEGPEFQLISPEAQVPVLLVNKRPLTQSLAIISYIDSLRATELPSVFPEAPEQRAQAIGICERVSSFIQPLTLPGAIRRSLRFHFDNKEDDSFNSNAATFVKSTLIQNLQLLDNSIASNGGPFSIGPKFSIADIFVYPQLIGATRLEIELSQFSHLSVLAKTMATLPYVDLADPLRLPDAPKNSLL